MGRGCQTLCLTAGKAHAAAADHGVEPLLHRVDFTVKRGELEIVHRVAVNAAEDVGAHGVVPQLGIVAKVTDCRRDLARRKF